MDVPGTQSRRDLLRRGTLGAAAAGAVWVAPAIDSFVTEAAAASLNCSPAGTYTVDWTTFANGAPGAGLGFYPWNVATLGGSTLTFSWADNTSSILFTGGSAPFPTGARPASR